MFRKLLMLMAVLLPQPLKRSTYRVLGWQIGRNVRIGLSYIHANEVSIGDNVRIGHGNLFRNVKHLSIGHDTVIANSNHFFGTTYGPEWAGELQIGEYVHWMSRHFVDVSGTVQIGDRAVVGGRDTQIWTHEYCPLEGGILKPRRVSVGDDVYIGARSLLFDCRIPDGAIVGAGSVVTHDFEPDTCRLLIAGNPAEVRKRYEQSDQI